MSEAPEKIWAVPGERRGWYAAYASDEPMMANPEWEYHLARPNQPCSTDEFLIRLMDTPLEDHWIVEAIEDWVKGNFDDALWRVCRECDIDQLNAILERAK